jgi:hypothetical protein
VAENTPNNSVSQSQESNVPATPATKQSKPKAEAFFLEPDDAKTLGNIDFMRSANKIRRTFPKQKVGADNAVVREVSSIDMKVSNGTSSNGMTANGTSSNGSLPAPKTESNGTQPSPSPVVEQGEERRRTDSSMDMFRNMARDLRKK